MNYNDISNIISQLATVSDGKVVSMDTITDVKLKGGKKNPYQGRVQKHSIGMKAILFTNEYSNGYEAMVNERLIKEGKEGNFKVGVPVWGTRIDGTPFISHKDEIYIQIVVEKPPKTEYLVDGIVTDKEEIEGLPDKQEEGNQNGLEDKVIVRRYKISSIISIK